MGPRSFDRGEPARSAAAAIPTGGFNGAAVFRPRRVHPLLAGEALLAASMGPRSFDRGELRCLFGRNSQTASLQWGRGLSTAESTLCAHCSKPFKPCFNGAAVF